MGCLTSQESGLQDAGPNNSRHGTTTIKVNKGRKQQGVHELKQNYIIDSKTQVLGTGAFGKVFKTHNKIDTSINVAIKVLDKIKLADNIDCIIEEVHILNTLDHPNIVKYFETYDDSKYIYLVMEYISGCQLFDKITKQENQTFTERQAAEYMHQLFSAINHCHAQGVIHRDIKPENIMINDSNSVRLIDFGLSKASTKKTLHTIAGTPYYMAPEVLDGNYNSKADIWSLGVLLYTLVSGYLPFQGNQSHDVFRKIKEGKYHFDHKEFESVSKECKDLIKQLLVVNHKKRLTGKEAFQHPWFNILKSQSGDVKIGGDVLERLQSFKGVSHFKRAAMNLLVKMASEDEVKDLRIQFQKLDEDGSGMILASELSKIIQQQNMNMSETDVKNLIKEVDYHGNGKINYSEFLSATINVQTFLNDTRLMAIFQQFDTDNSGRITVENIHYAFEKLGQEIPKDEIQQMVAKHDLTDDGMLSFDEFKFIFKQQDSPFGADGPQTKE